jgi:hypothetical protein
MFSPLGDREMEIFAEAFEAPIDSQEHTLLRDTAWNGGPLVEGRYLLGMLTGTNLFRVSDDEYARTLYEFISHRVSPRAAAIFCPTYDLQLMPYLRLVYHRETDFPAINMGVPSVPSSRRNERVERGIEYLLHNLDASIEDIAKVLATTQKQVLRMSDVTYAHRMIQRYWEAGSQ